MRVSATGYNFSTAFGEQDSAFSVYCKEFHGNIQKLAHRIPIVFGGVLNF
jgi:hypothetical protein